MHRRTRSSVVGRVWSAAKRIAGARLQPRMPTIALISTICSPSGHSPNLVQSACVCKPGPVSKRISGSMT